MLRYGLLEGGLSALRVAAKESLLDDGERVLVVSILKEHLDPFTPYVDVLLAILVGDFGALRDDLIAHLVVALVAMESSILNPKLCNMYAYHISLSLPISAFMGSTVSRASLKVFNTILSSRLYNLMRFNHSLTLYLFYLSAQLFNNNGRLSSRFSNRCSLRSISSLTSISSAAS